MLFYRVPNTKLKMYTTVKKEVAKGVFRRPDVMYIIKEEELERIEKEAKISASAQRKETAVKQQSSSVGEEETKSTDERKQTIRAEETKQYQQRATISKGKEESDV